MAKFGSDDVAFLLIDGYNVLGDTTTLEHEVTALTEPTHGLGDSWEEHTYTGIRRAMLTQEGFYDDAALAMNAALVSTPGTARVLCFGIEQNTIGRKFVGYSGAMQVGYTRVATRGELHKANASYQGSGVAENGRILHVHQAETAASGNTQASSYDGSAQSANGGAGYLQVSALTLGGYTDVVMKVQHSTDNAAWVDLITFTAVTAAPAAQRSTVAGTVRRYLASSWAFTGAGAAQTVTFMVGMVRD